MQPINPFYLEPDEHYWAKRKGAPDADLQVVYISTVFGSDPDFLTTAVLSSNQHHSLQDFVYVAKIERSVLQEDLASAVT
ncbi:hypothetical protein REJC140_03714 [Pseudorhizobium endolithicum]|uniref:Uncharacterized protein n=1 Tax=Pseudorhizobium endolithicum TaxID=1191678 RepID=A0ABM8PMI1_9HYPH|nr:hypothetical protein [Pseudorhizobium endolithicum]CAD7037863.1 hypothetical protein REJC140_03714 [Pseudorhizobium endolithicum]